MKHELKAWPDYFARLLDGSKTFEVRKDDRGFQAGDMVLIREYDPKSTMLPLVLPHYTGRELWFRVGYVAKGNLFGLKLGNTAILSLIPHDGADPDMIAMQSWVAEAGDEQVGCPDPCDHDQCPACAPPLAAMVGAIPNLTDGLTPEEYLADQWCGHSYQPAVDSDGDTWHIHTCGEVASSTTAQGPPPNCPISCGYVDTWQPLYWRTEEDPAPTTGAPPTWPSERPTGCSCYVREDPEYGEQWTRPDGGCLVHREPSLRELQQIDDTTAAQDPMSNARVSTTPHADQCHADGCTTRTTLICARCMTPRCRIHGSLNTKTWKHPDGADCVEATSA